MEPRAIRRIQSADRGAGMVECVLLVTLIALIAMPAFTPLQIGVKRTFCRILIQQWDVSGYFVESTGRCKKHSMPISGYYW